MFNSGTSAKYAHEEKQPRDNLNAQLIFQNKACGRGIIYSEKKYLEKFSKKRINQILSTIVVEMRQEIKRLEAQDNDYIVSYPTPMRVLELELDTVETFEMIERHVFESKMTISEAYNLAFKVFFKKAQRRLSNTYSKAFMLKVERNFNLLQLRMQSIIQRILLDEFQKTIKKDTILVIDKFIPEVFFQLNPHIKGIVYKKAYQQILFNHIAITFQIPIVEFAGLINKNDRIIIDAELKQVIVNPSRKQMRQYQETLYIEQDRCYIENPLKNTKFKLNAMIANHLDVDLVRLNPSFNSGLLYFTDPIIIAKGASLTVEEWELRINYIFSHFNGLEIMIRLPGFDDYLTLPELDSRTTDIDMLGNFPEYYEPLVCAAAKAGLKYNDKKISIVVPHVWFLYDGESWDMHVREMFKYYGFNRDINVIFEFDSVRAMYEMEVLTKADGLLMNIDYLAHDYIPYNIFSRDVLDIKDLKANNVYADLQYARQICKSSQFKPRNMLSGYHLQTYSIFRRLMIAGYREFTIPVQTPFHVLEIIESRLARQGKFVGVYKRDRERTLYYREHRKKAKDKVNYKRPYGLYKKVEEELKKEKNNKDNVSTKSKEDLDKNKEK